MNPNASDARDGMAPSSLWQRAPLWRACVCAAVLLSAVVVCFPPSWREAGAKPQAAAAESVVYDPPPAPTAAPAPAPAPAAAAAHDVAAAAVPAAASVVASVAPRK